MANNDIASKFNQLFGGGASGGQATSQPKQQQTTPAYQPAAPVQRSQAVSDQIVNAVTAVTQGAGDVAKNAIDRALALSGTPCRDHGLLNIASIIYRGVGLSAQALDFANQAIALDRNTADYYVSKGMAEALLGSPEVVYPTVKNTLLMAAQKAVETGELDSKALALGYLSSCGFNSYILSLKAGSVKRGEWPPEIVDYANQALGIDAECIDALRTLNNVANEKQQMEAKRGQAEKNASGKVSLTKGKKVTLEKNQGSEIIIENGWAAYDKDYDLKALVRYRDGRTVYVGAANADEVLRTPEGAVRHGGDVLRAGELERIYIKWDPSIASIAVSSYSALENGAGSFSRYGVFVRIINGSQVVEIPAKDTSANDLSFTLCFGEILFGQVPGSMQVVALEMYSAPKSENRVGYAGPYLFMDIGPMGKPK